MGVMKKEAELGSTKFHHKEVGVVPRDKASSETDEAGFRAMDEDMGWSKTMTAMRAGGVVTHAGPKAIRVVSMKCVTRDQLEARRLEIARASNKAPQGKIRERARRGVGKDWVRRVRL